MYKEEIFMQGEDEDRFWLEFDEVQADWTEPYLSQYCGMIEGGRIVELEDIHKVFREVDLIGKYVIARYPGTAIYTEVESEGKL